MNGGVPDPLLDGIPTLPIHDLATTALETSAVPSFDRWAGVPDE
jgi:hypothetical protein